MKKKSYICLEQFTKKKVMVIRIQKDSVSYTDLHKYLISTFPKYRFWVIGDNVLKITNKDLFGIYITVKRNKIIIKKGFASNKLSLLAALLFLVLGIVFPLLVYFLFIYPRMNMFSQEILDAIYAYYRNNVLNYSFYDSYNLDSDE